MGSHATLRSIHGRSVVVVVMVVVDTVEVLVVAVAVDDVTVDDDVEDELDEVEDIVVVVIVGVCVDVLVFCSSVLDVLETGIVVLAVNGATAAAVLRLVSTALSEGHVGGTTNPAQSSELSRGLDLRRRSSDLACTRVLNRGRTTGGEGSATASFCTE